VAFTAGSLPFKTGGESWPNTMIFDPNMSTRKTKTFLIAAYLLLFQSQRQFRRSA
jgi:hypothetical protein